MSFPRWTNTLTVFHPGMDEQHQKLFSLAEILWLSVNEDGEMIDRAVQDLVDYTYSHFAYEEAFLVNIGYGGLVEHKRKHESIFRAVDTIVDKYATEDKKVFVNELSIFVAEWLVRHIVAEDMEYARFIAQQRMRRATDTAPPSPPIAPRPAPADPVERLRRLKAAFEEGLISADEFDTRKQEILAQL